MSNIVVDILKSVMARTAPVDPTEAITQALILEAPRPIWGGVQYEVAKALEIRAKMDGCTKVKARYSGDKATPAYIEHNAEISALAPGGDVDSVADAWTLEDFKQDFQSRRRAADEAFAKLSREMAPLKAKITAALLQYRDEVVAELAEQEKAAWGRFGLAHRESELLALLRSLDAYITNGGKAFSMILQATK